MSVRSDGKAGRPRKDYILTLGVAKEIAMIGATARGKAPGFTRCRAT